MSNFSRWLNKGEIQKVAVTDDSLKALARVVERDLEDARIESLSLDRRFATAYSAALGAANLLIRRQGFRVAAKIGHHKVTFEIAGEILGPAIADLIDYFDLCRRKRNQVDYDNADVVSRTEVEELISATQKFKNMIF